MNHIRKGIARSIACATIVLCCTGVSPGVEFAGGTGEPNDPYRVATVEQLIAIGSDPNLLSRHYVLVASIDLSGMAWSTPVISSFAGSLDGNGHAIRNLSARGVGPQGLIGQIQDAGRVMNLNLVDVDLIGTGAVGGLAAYNAGTVRNCSSIGRVIGTGDDAGGLVGSNSGTITGSHSVADVIGSNRVGGLAGYNQRGILANCGSTASIIGINYVGGLVGTNDGSISASYSDSDVTGGDDLGGLAGYNLGGISFCYSMGNVTGGTDAGGLVGTNAGKVSSCYSLAGVTSEAIPVAATVGGLVGGQQANSTRVVAVDSYFLAPTDGGGPDNKIGAPLTAAQMAQQTSFVNWDFWGADADGLADRWFMPAGSPPVLAWQTEITGLQLVPDVAGLPLDRARAALTAAGFIPGAGSYDHDRALSGGVAIHADPSSIAPVGESIGLVLSSGTAYDWADNPGDGTEANPYQIRTPGQLESLTDHPELLDKHFVLTADLDMAGRTYSAALIARDIDNVKTDFQGTPFSGVFDGRGHTIRHLVISGGGRPYVGLFGMIDAAGWVGHLNLLDATVRGAGILAGDNYGAITNCSVTNSVLGSLRTGGGLVGTNHGTVTDCYEDIVLMSPVPVRR